MSQSDLIEEAVLRRALRLERDEPMPRIDVAALALAGAAHDRPAVGVVGGLVLALASITVAALLGTAAEGLGVLALALVADFLDGAIALAVPLAEGLAVLRLFPSPLTIAATVVAAVLYVRQTERSIDRVRAP